MGNLTVLKQAYLRKSADVPQVNVNLVNPATSAAYQPFRDIYGFQKLRPIIRSYDQLAEDNLIKNRLYSDFIRDEQLTKKKIAQEIEQPKINVNLVDPNQQYIPFRDENGLIRYEQLTSLYNRLQQSGNQQIVSQNIPAPRGAEHPADQLIRGDASAADYSRKNYGPMVSRYIRSDFEPILQKRNAHLAQKIIKQNELAADNAYKSRLNYWHGLAQQGQNAGAKPQYQSPAELLQTAK
jgi:hypothetical protein